MGSEIADITEIIESDTRTGPTLRHAPLIIKCCLRSRVDDIVSRSARRQNLKSKVKRRAQHALPFKEGGLRA